MSARRYPSATCWYASATISASDMVSSSPATGGDRWGMRAPDLDLGSASIATSHNPASGDLAAGGPRSGATRIGTVSTPHDGLQHPVHFPTMPWTKHAPTTNKTNAKRGRMSYRGSRK